MSYVPRKLNVDVLNARAQHYVDEFKKPTVKNPQTGNMVSGRGYVMRDLYNLTFKDVFEHICEYMHENLDQDDLDRFWRGLEDFEPRRDDVFEELLLKKLAINPAGEHIFGHIGTTQLGNRVVGRYLAEVPRYRRFARKRRWHETLRGFPNIVVGREQTGTAMVPRRKQWPVYAGEIEEREAGSEVPDPLPETAEPFTLNPETFLALNPAVSAAGAIAMCDALVDLLDEGTGAATIRGRTGSQPADPDATESGTLLFTCTMSGTAFGNASDNSPGAIATAASISDDTSADATGTLGYCRAGSIGSGGGNDHIDGTAGTTSSFDYNFNTVSIVAGATISITSLTFEQEQTN